MVFEYLTQHHQMESLAEVYAEGAQPGQKKAEAKVRPRRRTPVRAASRRRPSRPPSPPRRSAPKSRVPQKKVVDTRKAADVNLDRYDQHLEDLAPERAERMQQGQGSRRSSSRAATASSSSASPPSAVRRSRPARCAASSRRSPARPVKVQIPDEISVGELASRMKKTGAEVVKTLMKNGVMASLSDVIDFDTAAIIAEELGCVVEHEVIVTIEERRIDDHEDKEEDLVERPSSLWSWATSTTARPPAGLYPPRQCGLRRGRRHHPAIGAYQVTVGERHHLPGHPGHEAFTPCAPAAP